MAATRTATTAVATIPKSLSPDQLRALLGQSGMVPQGGGRNAHRLSLNGGILTTDDGEMFPPRKGQPSLTVRITEPPKYYNAFFLSEKTDNGGFNAATIGRADMNGRFCRKYDDPNDQAADTNQANELYDQIAAITGTRGSFKGDMKVQIVPPTGELTGDEPEYTLSLSQTSVFEWRGSSRDPFAGTVSPDNFIVRLADFAAQKCAEAGGDESAQQKAVLDAMTALRLGGVVADVYLHQDFSEDKSRNWWVISFTPVHVEPLDTIMELGAGDTPGDLPF